MSVGGDQRKLFPTPTLLTSKLAVDGMWSYLLKGWNSRHISVGIIPLSLSSSSRLGSYLDKCCRLPHSRGSRCTRSCRCCWCSERTHHRVWKEGGHFTIMTEGKFSQSHLYLHSFSSGMAQPLPPQPSLQWHWEFRHAPLIQRCPVVYRQLSEKGKIIQTLYLFYYDFCFVRLLSNN